MCIFRFVTKFNIFNIFVKFSIFMQNFQYLRINPQYLCKIFNICTFAFCSSLSGLCTSWIYPASGVRERDCSGFVLFVSKSSILRICSYIGIFLPSLFCVQADLCLTSGVREREYLYLHFSYLCASFVFLYII